ncbi:MAG: DUF4062 domain-containing protein [Chloroflexi bacterium]|nr:DUF4062 domain-containing protein [Chloroflexota bacterium]
MATHVYVSDTGSDLQDLRPIIVEQIRAAGMTPVWLDEADKASPDVLDIMRRKMQGVPCFLGVVSFVQGWQPVGGQSLAELEYQLARQSVPYIAMLMPQPDSPLGKSLQRRAMLQPPSQRAAQLTFWQTVQADGHALPFRDETDLARKLGQVLRQWANLPLAPTVQPPPPPLSAPAAPAPAPSAASPLDRLRPRREPPPALGPAPDIEALSDRIAEKTAARLAQFQLQQQQDLAKNAMDINEALRLWPGELVFGRPLKTRQFQNDVFVIMPFAAPFVPTYRDVIKPLADELRLTMLRGDELSSSRGSVMEEVWAALNACRFVIAEITGGNDNVFYELGIAHTLNKPAILITQAATPEGVPFDIRHLRYIRYEASPDGSARLRADLRTAVTRLLAELDEDWAV